MGEFSNVARWLPVPVVPVCLCRMRVPYLIPKTCQSPPPAASSLHAIRRRLLVPLLRSFWTPLCVAPRLSSEDTKGEQDGL